jgi:glycine/D-amino acid oxidase-like deaminating enzyme/nitrite reductase/ring-hydroxylating ferredoxin subunit
MVGDFAKVDVAIVGGGITGVCAAIRLKELGMKVAIIEALKIGTGVTSNSTAKLSSLHSASYSGLVKKWGEDGAQTYASFNEMGIDRVANLVKQYDIQCDFEYRDNITYATLPENLKTIQKEVKNARRAGLDADFIKEVKNLPYPIVGGIRVKNQAQFNPYAFCLGVAQKVQGNGSLVFEDSRVMEISNSAPHKIRTDDGRIEADYVIVATHLPILDRSGHFATCKPSQSVCLAYRLKQPLPMDMSISIELNPTVSLRDAEGGNVLIICGSSHSFGKPSFSSHEEHYKEMEAVAHRHFPIGECIARWSALDYIPPDSVHYIGRLYKGTRTIFTGTGYKKWGLAAGAAASVIFSDLIQGKDNPWLYLFDATRWDISRSFLQIGKLQLEVGKDFVVDRIKDHSARDSSLLQKGEGGIVKHNGEVVAMYKYPEGDKVVALSPTCTHLGCHVRWNDADLTWDCPCHGSRFNVEGEVLHAPAKSPLKRYDW